MMTAWKAESKALQADGEIVTEIRQRQFHVAPCDRCTLPESRTTTGKSLSVMINDQPAKLPGAQAGLADWEITIASPESGKVTASAKDQAGNVETRGHEFNVSPAHRIALKK